MSGVEFHEIRSTAEGRGLEVSARLENVSAGPWRPSEGFAAGYHIFDPDTGTLVVDGARAAPTGDIAPGESMPLSLRFDLPREPGRYRVFVSPLQEQAGWFYQRGWRFLLIDAVVDGAGARIERQRVVTAPSLRREHAVRALGRAFTLPAAAIWKHRSLIRGMVRRDVMGRYRGSLGGALWTALSPLLLMLTYFFVFGVVLEARFANDPSRAGFVLYFLAGMLPWLAISEAAARAPSVLIEHRNFVKKLVFPVETLPVNLAASGLVTQTFAMAVFAAGLFAARGGVPVTAIWLPVLLIPQILLTLGLCWFLAALGVYVRDLGQLIGYLLTLWFFLTPICYPETQLPTAALPLLGKNPLFTLVRSYRFILLDGRAPEFAPLWKFWVVGIVAFLGGHAWFYKLRRSFADLL